MARHLHIDYSPHVKPVTIDLEVSVGAGGKISQLFEELVAHHKRNGLDDTNAQDAAYQELADLYRTGHGHFRDYYVQLKGSKLDVAMLVEHQALRFYDEAMRSPGPVDAAKLRVILERTNSLLDELAIPARQILDDVEPAPLREPTPFEASIAEELAEKTEGTFTGKSGAAPEELAVPDPSRAAEVADLPQFSPRDVWVPPPGAPRRPPDDAPESMRLKWVRERLQLHVDQAGERLGVEGLTPGQAARVGDVPAPGVAPMPQMYPAFRGSRIDQFAKDSIMNDPDLAEVITAPDFFNEPDILHAALPDWFDITTHAEWARHLERYQQRYGARARRFEPR